jgi:hypothetical protein
MPEPITGAVIAKAASAAGSETATETGQLIQRILGPAADEFGRALARTVEYRTRNFGRIADRAAKKASGNLNQGIVNPRVAYVLLDEGSLCDDELMAEYLGGVLAGCRSPDGRDDRAATWTKVITGLSAFQIRAHYLLYREWADRLHGMSDLALGDQRDRENALMHVDLKEFLTLLMNVSTDLDPSAVISHTIPGIANAGLLAERYWIGGRYDSQLSKWAPFAEVLSVFPSVRGLELYGWAQGLPGLAPSQFPFVARTFEPTEPIARLNGVALPRLASQVERARLRRSDSPGLDARDDGQDNTHSARPSP